MINIDIKYPDKKYKDYIECVYNFCEENKFSMILKGSLSKGTATKYSDIDLIILGKVEGEKLEEIISKYDNPVMINVTENPKGILILVYKDNICVDMDLRESICEEELNDSKILLKYDNFIINNNEIVRKTISSPVILNKPLYYKILRLVHRATIKYLSNKKESAFNLLMEIKDSINTIGIDDLKYRNNFEYDIKNIFDEISKQFDVDADIKNLFNNLFKEF